MYTELECNTLSAEDLIRLITVIDQNGNYAIRIVKVS